MPRPRCRRSLPSRGKTVDFVFLSLPGLRMNVEAVCRHCDWSCLLSESESRRRHYCGRCGGLLRVRSSSAAPQSPATGVTDTLGSQPHVAGSAETHRSDRFVSDWSLDSVVTWLLVPLVCLLAGLVAVWAEPRLGLLVCGMISAIAGLVSFLAMLTLVLAVFAEGPLPGLAALFLPPFLLFWVVTHWTSARSGFLLGLMAGFVSLATRLGAILGESLVTAA